MSGTFIDSPVANLGYKTKSHEGFTDTNGKFRYEEGEYITFFIGDMEFPAIKARKELTPLQVGMTDNINNPVVINILRLLQSLDSDGNPANGIHIPDAAHAAATAIDFSQSSELFAGSDAITELLTNAGTHRTQLIPTSEAIRHFQETLGIGFSAGPFTADYYNGSTLVATKTVDQPAINYVWSDFHDIDSNNFRAIWKGDLVFNKKEQTINMNFNLSWSDIIVRVDGETIDSWSNSSKTLSRAFTAGTHQIEIEYFNNWHTTNLNTSFTNSDPMTVANASEFLSTPLNSNDYTIVYIGAYESDNLYNKREITLGATGSSIVLVASSNEAINWVIHNPHQINIAAIVYGSSGSSASLENPGNIPVVQVSGLSYKYDGVSQPASIQTLFGKPADLVMVNMQWTPSLSTFPDIQAKALSKQRASGWAC